MKKDENNKTEKGCYNTCHRQLLETNLPGVGSVSRRNDKLLGFFPIGYLGLLQRVEPRRLKICLKLKNQTNVINIYTKFEHHFISHLPLNS